MIPRLEGEEIESNFDYYLGLVRGGVAGFIVFGGETESLRQGIERLQSEAELPLIISSDLEQGLGQQVKGGTLFLPAAAVSRAERASPGLAKEVFECVAREAAYAGINTVFAPVLDVNTNPENPIISTRAFSDNPEEVSALGESMIRVFSKNGIVSCGKHFPGHGDTSVDSHLALPRVEKSLEELEACELRPFRAACAAGVHMMMLGHLDVPALDPGRIPATVSREVVRFLREDVGFSGMVITDAMNMGGLASLSAAEGSLRALEAGVDLLLHPQDPEELARQLEATGRDFDAGRIRSFRKTLTTRPASGPPPPLCEGLSGKATRDAIEVVGALSSLRDPYVMVLSDGEEDGSEFIAALGRKYPRIGHRTVTDNDDLDIPSGADLIIAVFSPVRAFKGGIPSWLSKALRTLGEKARVAVSFGSPHLLGDVSKDTPSICAWWGDREAQIAVADIIP
jgi:beta-glucosidase-like glycosyl hydrolase